MKLLSVREDTAELLQRDSGALETRLPAAENNHLLPQTLESRGSTEKVLRQAQTWSQNEVLVKGCYYSSLQLLSLTGCHLKINRSQQSEQRRLEICVYVHVRVCVFACAKAVIKGSDWMMSFWERIFRGLIPEWFANFIYELSFWISFVDFLCARLGGWWTLKIHDLQSCNGQDSPLRFNLQYLFLLTQMQLDLQQIAQQRGSREAPYLFPVMSLLLD